MASQLAPPGLASEDKGPSIIISMTSLTGVATLFIAARLFVRLRILGKMHWDDYLIVFSLVLGWVYTSLAIVGVRHGDGKHASVLSDEQKSAAHFWTLIGFAPGVYSFGFPKLAVVALLTRLLSPGTAHRCFLWGLAGVTLLNLTINLALQYSQCVPVAAMWDYRIADKVCRDPIVLVDVAFYAACFSAMVDFYLAVYPMVVLCRLQMPLKKKLWLSTALGFGSIAAVVAIYKCTRLPSIASQDFPYDTADLVIWTSIESNTLIIASCVPILQPLLDRCLGRRARIHSDYTSGKNRPNHHNNNHRHNNNNSTGEHNRWHQPPPRSNLDLSYQSWSWGGRQDIESVAEVEAESEPDQIARPIMAATASQESMLQRGEQNAGEAESPLALPDKGIIRTQVVIVSYEEKDKGPAGDGSDSEGRRP